MTTKDFRNAGLIGIGIGIFIAFGIITGTYLVNTIGAKPLQQESINLLYFYMYLFGRVSIVFSLIALFKALDRFVRRQVGDSLRGFLVGLTASFGLSNEVFAYWLPQILPNILSFQT
jgi:hypothetical protein